MMEKTTYDFRFKQSALSRLDMIYKTKKGLDKWLILWANEECPVQVGDKYPIKLGKDNSKDMDVSKVTALLVQDRKFVWKITGTIDWDWGSIEHSTILEMEEDNEI